MALPSPLAKARPRGKTFGKQLGPPPSSFGVNLENQSTSNDNTSNIALSSINSNNPLRTTIGTNTAIPEPAKETPHRQAELFANLDEAENLALELLSLASSTAQALADGTDTRVRSKKSSSSTAVWMQKGNNGKEYLDKVSKIHQLLSPHSNLVVAYRNHAVDTDQNSDSVKSTQSKKKDDENIDGNSNIDSDIKRKNPILDNLECNTNMYAARVELRLALERRDVLKDCLILEQQIASSNSTQINYNNVGELGYSLSTSLKRKREE